MGPSDRALELARLLCEKGLVGFDGADVYTIAYAIDEFFARERDVVVAHD